MIFHAFRGFFLIEICSFESLPMRFFPPKADAHARRVFYFASHSFLSFVDITRFELFGSLLLSLELRKIRKQMMFFKK